MRASRWRSNATSTVQRCFGVISLNADQSVQAATLRHACNCNHMATRLLWSLLCCSRTCLPETSSSRYTRAVAWLPTFLSGTAHIPASTSTQDPISRDFHVDNGQLLARSNKNVTGGRLAECGDNVARPEFIAILSAALESWYPVEIVREIRAKCYLPSILLRK